MPTGELPTIFLEKKEGLNRPLPAWNVFQGDW